MDCLGQWRVGMRRIFGLLRYSADLVPILNIRYSAEAWYRMTYQSDKNKGKENICFWQTSNDNYWWKIIHLKNEKTHILRWINFWNNGSLSTQRADKNVTWFFLNYQRGKCTKQPIRINKFGCLASQIFKLVRFAFNCFIRCSSATILIDFSAEITALKRHELWRSIAIALTIL